MYNAHIDALYELKSNVHHSHKLTAVFNRKRESVSAIVDSSPSQLPSEKYFCTSLLGGTPECCPLNYE